MVEDMIRHRLPRAVREDCPAFRKNWRELEPRINQREVQIEEECLKVLALAPARGGRPAPRDDGAQGERRPRDGSPTWP